MSDQNLLRAVERFAQTMEASGLPRMASRVFAYVLADDADRYTAAELAEGLRVSPAAISGAVRYLLDTKLLFREREPGMRSDLYRVYDDDVWSTIMSARIPVYDHLILGIDEALELIGSDSLGGRRLLETREFFAYIQGQIDDAMRRWPEHRKTLPHV